MRRRNGNGSTQLLDMTEKFRRGELKLIKVLEDAGYLTEAERTVFVEQVRHSVAQKRSSEVLSTAHLLHNKLIRVLSEVKEGAGRSENREIEFLLEVSRLVQTTSRQEEAFEKLLDLIKGVIPYENATLFAMNGATKQLVVGAVRGQTVDLIGGVQFDFGPGFSSWVAKQKKPILLNELHRSPGATTPQLGSFLSVPLVVQQELIGVLNFGHPNNHAFTNDHLRLLTVVAGQTAAVLQRILMYEEMARLAITDELTGLYNRRHFQECLTREVSRAKRYEQPFALLFFDLDHFKRINDTCGHAVGDRVLADLGKLLRRWARSTDLLARYGGEEFVAFLPMTDLAQAMSAAERMRVAVEAHSFPRRKRLTVSIGIATYPQDGETAADVLKKADQALYQAKKAGRNRSIALVERVAA